MSDLKTITVHDINHNSTVDINISSLRFFRTADIVEKGRLGWIDAELTFVSDGGSMTYANFENGHGAVEVTFNKPIEDVRKMFEEFLLSDDLQIDWSKETLSSSTVRKLRTEVKNAASARERKAQQDAIDAQKAAEKAARQAKIQRFKNIAGHFNIVGKIKRNGFWWENKNKGQKVDVKGEKAKAADAPEAKQPAKAAAKQTP